MAWASTSKCILLNKNKASLMVSRLKNTHGYILNVKSKNHGYPILFRDIQSLSSEHNIDESKCLSFTLPDLSQQEIRYVKGQVDVILNPACLQPVTNPSDLNITTNQESTSCPTYDLKDPECLKRIFPISSKNGSFHSLNVCVEVMRAGGYPSFAVPNSLGEIFKRNFCHPLLAERIVASLQTWGVTEEDLQKDPSLVIDSLSGIAKYGKTADLFHISTLEAKALYDGKNKPALRGNYIREKIRLFENSLKLLGFADFGANMNKDLARHFEKMINANILEVDKISTTVMVKELVDLTEFSSKDDKSFFKAKMTDNLLGLIGASDAQVFIKRTYG